MATIVTRFMNVSASPSSPVIRIPTAQEIALLQSPSLTAWWRPDSQYNVNNTWVDRKNGDALVRADAQGWSDVVEGGLNNKPYLNRETGVSKFMILKSDEAKFPLSPDSTGYTFVWVGKPTLFDRPAQCAIFAPVADTASNAGYIGYDNTARRIWLRHRSVAYINYGIPTPEDNHVFVASFDYESQTGVLYMDGEQVATGTATNLPFSDKLSIFCSLKEDGSYGLGSFAGNIYDLMIYDKALHLPGNSNQLDTLNGYISNRYGL